jgi:glutamate racemase
VAVERATLYEHLVEPVVLLLEALLYICDNLLIEGVIGDRDIEVIDSGEAVARRVKWLLERYDIAADGVSVPEFKFLSFADEEYRQRLEERALSLEL